MPFLTLTDVKIYNDYTYIKTVAPTTSELEPLYVAGETWLDEVTGLSYELIDQVAGTWRQIEQAEDIKITRELDNIFNRTIEYINNQFLVERNSLDSLEDSSFPSSFNNIFNARDAGMVYNLESVYSNFTFDATGKTITPSPDIIGTIANYAVGDSLLIAGSRRNDKYVTVTVITSSVITVTEDLSNGSANCFIFLANIPAGFISVVGRLLWYDVFERNATSGLQSEKVGTYSWTKAPMSNGLRYPDDILSGLDVYESFTTGGISVYVP